MRNSLVGILGILCALLLLNVSLSFATVDQGNVILEIQNTTVVKKTVSFGLYIDGPDNIQGVILNVVVSDGTNKQYFNEIFNPTEYGVNNVNFTISYPGTYTFYFELTDGNETDNQTTHATITNTVPILNLIGGKQVLEGGNIEFTMVSSDSDDDALMYITNSSFGTLNANSGHFLWNTKYNESGIYFVQFMATDGIELASEILMINVTESGNHAPVLDLIGGKQILEGETLQFQIRANDPDNDLIFYSTNSSSGTLNPHTGEYSWTTNYQDSGIYFMLFSATDGVGSSSEIIMVNITESGNHAPILYPIGNRQVEEGQKLEFTATAIDEDNDDVSFSTNATKGSIGSSSGVFTFEPGFSDSGVYLVEIFASDGVSTSSETITIEVFDVPQQSSTEKESEEDSFGITVFGSRSNGRNIPLAKEKIKLIETTDGTSDTSDTQEIKQDGLSLSPTSSSFSEITTEPKEFGVSEAITGNTIRNAQMMTPTAMEIITTLLVLTIAGSGVYLAFVALSRKKSGRITN